MFGRRRRRLDAAAVEDHSKKQSGGYARHEKTEICPFREALLQTEVVEYLVLHGRYRKTDAAQHGKRKALHDKVPIRQNVPQRPSLCIFFILVNAIEY